MYREELIKIKMSYESPEVMDARWSEIREAERRVAECVFQLLLYVTDRSLEFLHQEKMAMQERERDSDNMHATVIGVVDSLDDKQRQLKEFERKYSGLVQELNVCQQEKVMISYVDSIRS